MEVELDDRVRAVPPAPLMRRVLLSAARLLPGAAPPAKRLGEVSRHRLDGWNFVDVERIPALAARGIRRYGVVRHTDGVVAVLTGCVAVELTPSGDLEALQRKHQLSLVHTFRFAARLYQLRVRPGDDPLTVANLLRTEPGVRAAEPELREPLQPRQRLEDDPLLAQQEQWEAIDAAAAWRAGVLGTGVVIAIIDQGCFLGHRDLGPPFGPVGYFHDGSDEGTVFEPTAAGFPRKSHGTFCAGMALARANGEGGRGVAPQAALAVVGLRHETFSQEVLARAVAFATSPGSEVPGREESGADVISCSVDVALPVRTVLRRALDATAGGRSGRGVPVFWAVPNAPVPIPDDGVCSVPVVIPVGAAIGRLGPDTCAFGPQLEFLAPGRTVLSTSGDGSYARHSGTSFATPIAAGIAALILGLNPALSADEVRAKMRASCTPVNGAGRTPTAGHGIVNAAAAVRLARLS